MKFLPLISGSDTIRDAVDRNRSRVVPEEGLELPLALVQGVQCIPAPDLGSSFYRDDVDDLPGLRWQIERFTSQNAEDPDNLPFEIAQRCPGIAPDIKLPEIPALREVPADLIRYTQNPFLAVFSQGVPLRE